MGLKAIACALAAAMAVVQSGTATRVVPKELQKVEPIWNGLKHYKSTIALDAFKPPYVKVKIPEVDLGDGEKPKATGDVANARDDPRSGRGDKKARGEALGPEEAAEAPKFGGFPCGWDDDDAEAPEGFKKDRRSRGGRRNSTDDAEEGYKKAWAEDGDDEDEEEDDDEDSFGKGVLGNSPKVLEKFKEKFPLKGLANCSDFEGFEGKRKGRRSGYGEGKGEGKKVGSDAKKSEYKEKEPEEYKSKPATGDLPAAGAGKAAPKKDYKGVNGIAQKKKTYE